MRPAAGSCDGADSAATGAACIAARDEERALLARELHDGLSAELTALRYALARLAPMTGDTHAETPCGNQPTAAALADADKALKAAFQEIRRLIDERSPPLPAQDPISHLRHWVSAFAQRVSLDATFECPFQPTANDIDGAVAIAALRITQEALNNIAKHAHATAVLVRLEWRPDSTTLVVQDNGRGLDPRADQARQMHAYERDGRHSHGIGLNSMRQRCEALGGTLELRPGPGGSGLTIHATLPRQQ